MTGASTTGAGGTVWSGLEPQEVLSAIPAAAARIIAIFIVVFGLLVWFFGGIERVVFYLVAGTSTGGAGAFEQQDALTMTPHAAAAIAIILTIFID